MIELIHQYYIDEKSWLIYALTFGLLFFMTGIFMVVKFSVHPVSKGLGTGLIIAGTILLVISYLGNNYNNKKAESLETRKLESEHQLQQSETIRMEKVMNQTFKYAFYAFGVLITAFLTVIILSKNYYLKGLLAGLILLVVLILVFDLYNSERNQRYLKAVRAYEIHQ